MRGLLVSGKSTILAKLEEQAQDFAVFQEPVDIWRNFEGMNLLHANYEASKRGICAEVFEVTAAHDGFLCFLTPFYSFRFWSLPLFLRGIARSLWQEKRRSSWREALHPHWLGYFGQQDC